MLRYECSRNPSEARRDAIMAYIRDNASVYIGKERASEVKAKAAEIMRSGVKAKDACHVASAILAGCDAFISTDKRLLRYDTDEIRMVSPVTFIARMEEDQDGYDEI